MTSLSAVRTGRRSRFDVGLDCTWDLASSSSTHLLSRTGRWTDLSHRLTNGGKRFNNSLSRTDGSNHCMGVGKGTRLVGCVGPLQ